MNLKFNLKKIGKKVLVYVKLINNYFTVYEISLMILELNLENYFFWLLNEPLISPI